ncbi:hypothetical protein [Haloferula sp. BvORR071]|uniref:hypothetical protein n=1 Tax=Haloferula sp. BvORR071 TaxID=1396141 RepID=UPI000555C5B7|nr:hypothetical protein [Haloferula sp. BvORR071]
MKRSSKLLLAGVLVLTHAAVFMAAMQGPAIGKSGAAMPQGGGVAREAKSVPRDSGGLSHAQLYGKLSRAAGLSEEELLRAKGKLLGDWARRDLGALLDQMWGPRARLGLGTHASDEVVAEMVKQKEQVWDWIRSGRFGSNRQEAFSAWFSAMRDGGQAGFVLASLPQASPYEKRWALHALCDQADGSLLKEVRDALLGWYKDDPQRWGLINQSYARRQAELAAGNVQALFQGETDPGVREGLGAAWLQQRIGYPPPVDRLNEIMELPADARGLAVSNLINNYDDHGLASFMPALVEMNRLGLWKEMSGDAGQESVRYLAGKASGNPGEFLGTLAAISDGEARAILLESAGRGMSGGQKDAEALAGMLEVLPAGLERDACLAGMVQAQVSTKKDLAKKNLGRIGDPGKREELLKKFPDLGK